MFQVVKQSGMFPKQRTVQWCKVCQTNKNAHGAKTQQVRFPLTSKQMAFLGKWIKLRETIHFTY